MSFFPGRHGAAPLPSPPTGNLSRADTVTQHRVSIHRASDPSSSSAAQHGDVQQLHVHIFSPLVQTVSTIK
ncbi:unnamed protein product [Merluccius merluccius]